MKLKVLGASGSEVPGHNCPAFLVDGVILLDAGTVGMSLNIREEKTLGTVLLTHAHFDHMKGLPFLFDNLAIRGESDRTVTVAGGEEVLDDLRMHVFNGRIWPDFSRIPTAESPVVRYRTLAAGRPWELDGYRVTMERVSHTVPSYGFVIEAPGGGAVAYTGDTGPTEAFWRLLSGIDVGCLIVECSFPGRLEELALRSGHLTPALLKAELSKIGRPPARILVTHMKPQLLAEIMGELKSLGLPNLSFPIEGETLTV